MLTVGEVLHKARLYRNANLAEIAEETKINARYLKYIEKDQLDKFDSATQLYGFIKNFADYLGVDEKKITAIYKRQVARDKPVLAKPRSRFSLPNVTITYRQLGLVIIALFLVLTFGYLITQFYRLQQPPRLELTSPEKTSFTTEQESITIKGVTETDVYLSINGQQIKYNEDNGTFSFNATLKEGRNTFKVTAQAQYNEDKSTSIQLVIKRVAAGTLAEDETDNSNGESGNGNNNTPTPTPPPTEANINIQVSGGEAWLQVIVDDIQEMVGVYPTGTSESFKAKQSFSVVTGRPAITFVTINGEEQELGLNNGVGGIKCTINNGEVECE